MIPDRADIPKVHRWNVEAMYSTTEEWYENFEKYKSSLKLSRLLSYKGKLSDPVSLEKALFHYFDIDEELTKLYTYAHLKHDEDTGEEEHKKNWMQAISSVTQFQTDISWLMPEILNISDNSFNRLLTTDSLKLYHFYLQQIHRMKEHTLSEREEKLLALSAKPLEAASRAFRAFNNADMKFEDILDGQGNSHPLSHGLFQIYMKSKDRVLRKNAFQGLSGAYLAHENTLAELLSGQVEAHIYAAKARNYANALEAALYPYNIDPKIYRNLIDTVHKFLPIMHRYIALRKKCLRLDAIYPYDTSVSLVEDIDFHKEYKEALQLVLESAAPLGENYQAIMQKGVTKEGWVDIYENRRKRSGAYSSGCYGSMPYILLNYHGSIRDVFTLAHELGHSMHTYLSHKHQPYLYSAYPIFVAEVASTFNEQLLLTTFLNNAQDKKMRGYLIDYAIDTIRGTLFRQTLFAEFELKLHEWVEAGVSLTPQFLKEEYGKLYSLYYGPDFIIDDTLCIEWAKIPHFYYNFYVYQYATGISAALALAEEVQKGEENRDKYLQFLSSGGSNYPLELLRIAGVDMATKKPIESALTHFENLVNELETLLE